MGVDCGDVDNDGLLDLFVTTYQQEPATLFRNLGNGLFSDVTRLTKAGDGSLRGPAPGALAGRRLPRSAW